MSKESLRVKGGVKSSSRIKNGSNTNMKSLLKRRIAEHTAAGASNVASTTSQSKATLLTKSEQASRYTVATVMSFGDDKDPRQYLERKHGYVVTKVLGEGGFAKVFLAQSKSCQEPGKIKLYAIKVFDRTDPTNALWITKCLSNELFISRKLKHQHIIITYEVFKTTSFGYIVMRYAPGGTLKDHLYERIHRPYNQAEARSVFQGLISGLEYIHNRNIAHRDLKLDNFLLMTNPEPPLTPHTVIADFGFAHCSSKQTEVVMSVIPCRTRCGTVGYMAPELINKKQGSSTSVTSGGTGGNGTYDGKAVDIFAMGVCLYEMLQLMKPFPLDTKESTLKLMQKNTIEYHEPPAMQASVKDLIKQMCHYEPGERPSAEAVAQHAWITGKVGAIVSFLLGKLKNE